MKGMLKTRIQILPDNKFSFIIILLCLIISSCSDSNKEKETKDSPPTDTALSLSKIQGGWKCIHRICFDIGKEDPCFGVKYFDHVLIQNDTLYGMNYPFQFYAMGKIQPDSSWKFMSTYKGIKNISFKNDTLNLDGDLYQRTDFNDNFVNTLIKDSINVFYIFGEWELVTYIEMGFQGVENYDGTIEFPFPLPKELKIDEKTIKADLMGGRYFKIPINGIKKIFYIKSMAENYIEFSTTAWFAEKFDFTYTRKNP